MNKREELVESVKEYVLENFDRLSKEPLIGDKMRNYTKEDVEERFGVALNIAQWEVELTDNTTNPLLDEYLREKNELIDYVVSVNHALFPDQRDLKADFFVTNELEVNLAGKYNSLNDAFTDFINKKHSLAKRVTEESNLNKSLKHDASIKYKEIALEQYGRIVETHGVKINTFGRDVESTIDENLDDYLLSDAGIQPIKYVFNIDSVSDLASLRITNSERDAIEMLDKLTPYGIEVDSELAKYQVSDIMTNAVSNLYAASHGIISRNKKIENAKNLIHYEVNEKIDDVKKLKTRGEELGLLSRVEVEKTKKKNKEHNSEER